MTVNKTDYFNWQNAGAVAQKRYNTKSPNLVALNDFLVKRFGGTNLGIYNKREVRSGGAPSSHSFGAALDFRYQTHNEATSKIIPWLVKNSKELGIQVIQDYVGCAIWTPGKGWRIVDKDGEFGQRWATWLHIETTKTDWGNKTRIESRGIELP